MKGQPDFGRLVRRQPAVLALTAVLLGLMVAPSAARVDPRGGTWKGKTTQGFPVEFVVKKKPKGWEIVSAEFTVKSKCKSGSPSTTTHAFPILDPDGEVDGGNRYKQKRRLGTWEWTHFGGGDLPSGGSAFSFSGIGGTFLAKGRAKKVRKAKKATGSLRRSIEVEEPGLPPVQCDSGLVGWTARRG